MGEIENRVRYLLNQAMLSDELMAASEDAPLKTDAMGAIVGVLLPILQAQRDAVMLLAAEVDRLSD